MARERSHLRALKTYVDSKSPVTADGAQTLTNKTLTTPVISTFYKDAGKTKLMTVPDVASDTLALLAAAQTFTNKTLTSPKVTQYVATHDYEAGTTDWTLSTTERLAQIITVSNANGAVNAIFNTGTPNFYLVYNNSGYVLTCKNSAGTTIAIANGKHAFIYNDGTNIVQAVDNLLSPRLVTPLVDDGDAGCTVTSANQTHGSATVTIPDCGDAADEFVLKDTTQTLTLKTLTSPVINSPDTTQGVSTHDYSGAAAAWTLSAGELKTQIITVSNANGAVDAIATPTAGKVYIVSNASGYALTFKATGQTGVTIANSKTAIVRGNGTDFVRVTADA